MRGEEAVCVLADLDEKQQALEDFLVCYGPRKGDRARLGDTGLVVEVESDAGKPGEEFVVGFGKTARDGLHILAATARQTCDLVISNVLLIDAGQGVRKASIGVRDGRIAGIGRAGNPNTLEDVDIVVGSGTTIIAGEGLIATAGAIDTHVHLLPPRVVEAELASGGTTVISQEFGPVWHSTLFRCSGTAVLRLSAFDERVLRTVLLRCASQITRAKGV